MSSYNNDAWELIHKWHTRAGAPQGSVWFPQAEPCLALWELLQSCDSKQIEISQTFKPYYQAFQKAGYSGSPNLDGTENFDFVFCVPTRQRSESLALMAKSLKKLKPQGKFVFACANAQGAAGYISRLKELCPSLEVESGNKCKWAVLKFSADFSKNEILESWLQEGQPCQIEGSNFFTIPGIFGWNKVDRGSEHLLSVLPQLSGKGADLGAGYGFLSHGLLQKSMVEELRLVEADARALEMAKKNLAQWPNICHFHWADVTAPELSKTLQNLDWVLMNPPFHEGRDTDSALGVSFIEAASKVLKKGGHLYMVANSFLPYEKTLNANFKKSQKLLEKEGFKVWHAQR